MRFLVVDDHPEVAHALARFFRAYGDVEIAPTVATAIEVLERAAFTAYVVDIRLPDGSGFEVIRRIQAREHAALIVVLSGDVDRDRLSTAHSLDVEYLLKPPSVEDLTLVAARALVRAAGTSDRIDAGVELWRRQYKLSESEAALLLLAAKGHRRSELSKLRGVEEPTIKTQVASLLRKTKHQSLDQAVSELLRDLVKSA